MMGIDSEQTVGGGSITELKESKRTLEALISSSIDAIIAIDPDKKIIKFSRQAENLLGYLETNMIGQSVEGLYEDKEKAKEIHRIIKNFGKIDRTDIVLVHKDGRKIPISFFGKLILDEVGNILGQIGFIRDSREDQLMAIRLKALIEASKAINSTSELREILEHVVLSALFAIPTADRGSIYFYVERSGTLNLMISSFDFSIKSSEALSFHFSEGIAGWVFEHQQPVIIGNTMADARYKRADPDVNPHRSMLCVPITSKRRKIGVMSLSHSMKLEAFSQFDLDLLIGFSDQAAVAIENANEITSIKKEADELEFLRNISLKINAQTNIEEILTALLESGNKLLGSEMAVVHWKGRREGIYKTFSAPAELQKLKTNPRLEDGLTAEVFRTGIPVVIPDTVQDARVNPLVLDAGIKSLVGYPLQLHGQVAGALFFNSRQRQFFGEHEIHLISLLLPLAAVAIANSNIIERLERSKHLSEALMQASSKLVSTHALEEQMIVLKQFMQAELVAPMFYLGLYDDIADIIHLKINYDNFVEQELINIPLKDRIDWTVSSYVVKKQLPIRWSTEAQKRAECERLGITPQQIGAACQTCVAVPLVVDGSLLGVISIQSVEPFAWDEIEVSTFLTLAHQASIAIRNVRLHEQVNRTRDTAMIVAQKTAQGILKNTLDSIVTGIKDVLGCNIVTLYTYRQEKNLFDYPPAMAGEILFPEMITAGSVSLGTAPYKVIEMDDIYYSEDSQNDKILGTPFAIRENVCASVAVPLVTRNKRVGVLFTNYCHGKHTFTKGELEIIDLFSLQAAVAISNAMMYEEEQKRREVLKIIDEAGRTVTSSLKLDEIFDSLVRQAHKLTGEKGQIASSASINIVEGNYVTLKAVYPPSEEENISNANLVTTDLNTGVNGRIGIIGLAVKKSASILVEDVKANPEYLSSNEHTKCELAVPIIYRNEVVGVINVEHNVIGGLDKDDQQAIESLAAHAAVAIQNARIYQVLQRKSQHQNAIYEASKTINKSLDLTEKELLKLLVEQMVVMIVPAVGAVNIWGAILLYNNEKKELKMECIYPSESFESQWIGQIRSLTNPLGGRIGITGRAILDKRPQREGDVTRNSDYLDYSKYTKSELDVPILEGDAILGVLSLECNLLNGFDKDAEDALCAFAELASIAIQNTRRFQELKETRATVGNFTAVAWMGLVAGAWRHTIGNMATTISDISELAENDLKNGASNEKINLRLNKIQEIVEEIQKIPMPPLSSEEGVEPVYIAQLVRDRINQFAGKKESYGDINFKMAFEIDELTTVRASPEWLRRILDVLIDNARNSMKGKKRKQINTLIVPNNEGVEILVSDTGVGIPDHLIPNLCKKPINKKNDEKGSGVGLFLASSIIQVYGGQLKIHSTSQDGTTMALWFPILNNRG